MVIFLELVYRGYKLIITTHSTLLLELAWAINYVKTHNGTANDLLTLFNFTKTAGTTLVPVFTKIITDATFSTYHFQRKNDGVYVENISRLDIDENEDNWGGLSAFATKTSNLISKLVSDAEKLQKLVSDAEN